MDLIENVMPLQYKIIVRLSIYFIRMNHPQYNSYEYYDVDHEDSKDTYRPDQIKNEYSTFIEELEETTEKLMNEVFNTEYKPEIDDHQDLIYQHKHKFSANKIAGQDGNSEDCFKKFIKRNHKWREMKDTHLQKQIKKKEEMERKTMRDVPQILRGSLQKIDPIYERALDIHSSKEKRIAYHKIEKKKKEEEKFHQQHSFQPEINEKMKIKTRTLDEYLRDKTNWEKKKKQSREIRKLQEEAKKYTECHFAPSLVAKQIPNNSRLRQGELVQDRLLRSLQKLAI